MIKTKDDLKRYLEMDKYAYHTERKHPKIIGDMEISDSFEKA